MKSIERIRACCVVTAVLLASCAVGCAAAAEDEAATDAEGALTSGTVDASFGAHGRVEGNETFLGEHGGALMFFGRDAHGPYVARRSGALVLDAAYGANGKAYFDLSNQTEGGIGDAALLPDGRVVGVGGKYAGRIEYVLDGVKVKIVAMLVVAVAADGKKQKLTSYDRLATQPYTDYDQGYRAYTLAGTAVTALADGRIAVGAGVGLYDSNNGEARLYAFSLNGLDVTFDRQLWGGARRSIYGSTQSYGVSSVMSLFEAGPGALLVGTSGRAAKPGDVLSRSSDTTYRSITPKAGAVATETTVYGSAEQYARTVATRLADGRVLLAGYNGNACAKTIALARLTPALTLESGFGNAASRPDLHCVAGATDAGTVTALAADATRSYVVTTSHDQSTVWAVGANGDVDASFGASGKVVVPGNASAAFVSGGYLYLQLWDAYLLGGEGAHDGGHFRRIKL